MSIEPNETTGATPAERSDQVQGMLESLLEISHFVGSVMLLDDILDRIVQITGKLMNVPVCSIYMLNSDQRLILRSNIGFEEELKGTASFALGEGIPGHVARTGEVIALADASTDKRYAPLPSTLELKCRAYMCVPLSIRTEIIGVMTARKREVYQFSPEEILFFETVCKQVAIVIEKARLHDEKIQAERLAAVAVSLSGVAHYIKNVLMTMKGGEYLIDHGIQKQDINRVSEGWDVLKRANRKIRGLVESILNYCSKSEPIRRPVNLNSMIFDMLGSLEGLARERQVEVTPDLAEDLDEVWIDPESMYDALLNLVGNGIEAIEPGRAGSVHVRTRQFKDRNQICIEVRDNGTGIPESDRDKIFNLFFSTKGKKGTGIGLAAARKIIESHGGSIEFETWDGQGTSFKVFLPTTRPEIESEE